MTQVGIKISKLPAASEANGTDQFETNQAGVSRRVTLDQMQFAAFGGALSAEMKAWLVTPTSLNLIAAVTDESGDGSLVFSNDPVFTGNPQAPTPATGDDSVSIATTAFVKAQDYATVTYVDAADALKASIAYVDAADALLAPLDSPALTGTPTAPTPAPGDNDTSIATTAFVAAAIAEGASITVGDTPPVSPNNNQLWWNSALGNLFIYYNDGNTTQWVPAAPAANPSGVQAAFNVRATAVDAVGTGANIPLFRTASTPVKDYDPNGVWDLANNRFTAPVTGRYSFTCHMYGAGSTPTLTGLIVRHSTAAGTVIRDYMQAQVVDTVPYGSDFVISTELEMVAGERVSFHVGNNSGTFTMAPVSSSVGGLVGATLCFAFGHKVN